MVTGNCNRCGKVWTLETGQGVCQWCNKPASCQSSTSKPRHIKSSRRRKQRQVPSSGNGYDQLTGDYATYYKVACRFAHKALIDDREDLLHTIILTLAIAKRTNGHKPFTLGTMHRIASRCVSDYWRAYYKVNNGLDCHTCSKAQRRKCKEDDLYTGCPKAIKLESLDKPILDSEGNLTTLGELIADDKAMELEGWVSPNLWELGYKRRLVDIAHKLHRGEALTDRDRQYLSRYRRQEQKSLFEDVTF